MKEELLRFENLSKRNRNKQQFYDIDFTICAGEAAGLISDNLRVQYILCEILKGNMLPDSGAIYIKGERTSRREAAEFFGHNVFFLDHIEKQSSELNIADIFLVSSWSGREHFIHYPKTEAALNEACKQYGIVLPPFSSKAKNLTVLERCQVALLRAALSGTRIFVLTDISGFLNGIDRIRLLETVSEFEKKGAGFLIIDHDRKILLENTQKLIVLRDGITAYILDDYSKKNIGILFPETKHEEDGTCAETTDTQTVILEFRRLTTKNLKNENIKIRQHEILGLTDSTSYKGMDILNVLQGNNHTYSGEMYLNQKLYLPKNLHDAVHSGIAFVYENSMMQSQLLLDNMSVQDNLILTLAEKKSGKSLSYYRRAVKRMCREFFGRDIADEKVDKLDFLDRQRLIYFRWILYYPGLLVCYHPFSGSNLYMRQVTEEMIKRCADRGITILIISNDFNEVSSKIGRAHV